MPWVGWMIIPKRAFTSGDQPAHSKRLRKSAESEESCAQGSCRAGQQRSERREIAAERRREESQCGERGKGEGGKVERGGPREPKR